MKKGVVFTLIFISVFIISIISASLTIGDSSNGIETQYSPSDFIKGWINISLSDELANSSIKDSYGNSATILELLKSDNSSSYTCAPTDCKSDYSSKSEETSKTFTLDKNQQKILGFKFTGGDFEDVTSFSAKIASSIGEKPSKQLFIDILNDDQVEWESYKASNNFYDEDYGCYESSAQTEDVLIYDEKYCEKVTLPIAPNVEIGAYVKEETGESAVFVLSLEGQGDDASCEVAGSSTGRISCIPSFEITKKGDYFICIKTKNSADNYKLKISSETNNPCGYANTEDNQRDFQVFVKPGKFASVGIFNLDTDETENSGKDVNLEGYINTYVKRYSDVCSSDKPCIIPIRFISEVDDQEITVSNISILYAASGTPKETKKIYDLIEAPAKVSAQQQKLYLEYLDFKISGQFGDEKTYTLDLNDEEILSEKIFFKKVPTIKSLNPKTAIAAYPTKFTVMIQGVGNSSIKSYKWVFGKNDSKITNENKTTYTFNKIGTSQIEVTVTDSNSLSSKRAFNISVKTPKDAIESVLKRKLNDFNNTTAEIKKLSMFYQSSLNKVLNIDEIESDLISLQKRNSTALDDSDYVKIMEDIVELNVPAYVFKSKSASSIKILPEEEKVNIEVLKEIGKGEYAEDEREEYINAIIIWNIENMDAEINFKEFSVSYDDFSERVLNTFEISIKENSEREDFYLIIKNIEGLDFKDNYGQRELLGHSYIKLGEEEKTIEFVSTEDVDFEEVQIFMSPEIKKLSPVKTSVLETERNLPSIGFIVLIVLLIGFVGLIGYIILQEWYKRKYETYLFKDRNNLFNLISYIENMGKKGTKPEEISKNLKKSGWNSEQVTYVMKKYLGKRTGMVEIISIEKVVNLLKKGKDNLKNISKKKPSQQEKIQKNKP